MSDPNLQDYTRAMLEECVFPGDDAAVIFVPEGTEMSAEVKEIVESAKQQRWYPVAGGHKAKIPYHFAEGHEALFAREEKGWDHEHCDFCESSIAIGELCWIAPSDRGFFVFCKQCHEKLPEKKPWWKFGR